jgi:hypothetical protein
MCRALLAVLFSLFFLSISFAALQETQLCLVWVRVAWAHCSICGEKDARSSAISRQAAWYVLGAASIAFDALHLLADVFILLLPIPVVVCLHTDAKKMSKFIFITDDFRSLCVGKVKVRYGNNLRSARGCTRRP